MYEVFLPRHTHPHLNEAEKTLRNKFGKRPAVYTGDSERSEQRKRKEERERVASIQDCDAKKFTAFFKTVQPLVAKKHRTMSQSNPSLNVIGTSDITIDVGDDATDLEIAVWSLELEAILDGQREDWFSVPEVPEFESVEELQEDGEEAVGQDEHEGIQVVREWTQESPEDEPAPASIMDILQGLIKMAKRCKTSQAVKALLPSTGLVYFIKLREKYKQHPKCCTPVTTASHITAQRLGLGAYFARQLRELEPYVLNMASCLLQRKGQLLNSKVF
ncbi:hypothetical protein M422DRAFT_49468 [Sphaerobolus stellatus SS14]|uniref:Uncharacterized protein n=1 Tax=Sphaerobolus stellatus (strain SS14) TaxID=990650 RepID=A0A0C9VPB4_SPHS4|nr:hypothetical protein M422DRAFT_49468 [Sphaerobolus stellatus SS14]